jgi:hypothetical protein
MFGKRTHHQRTSLRLEELEARNAPAIVSVNAGQVLRAVNPQLLGINVAWWDTHLNTAQTKLMVQTAGLTMFRFPGGSSSDTWHFNAPPTYGGEGTVASFAQFIASVSGEGMVTLNYGTGSPQEAAAFLAYLNAGASDPTPIGNGQEWNSTTSTWVQVNWQTAGYWASLRAATPITPNDGLNFLRIGRAAPFAFHYFEVGNEEYGSWETDKHGSGGDTGKPHDPATYVAFAKQFAAYAAQIDPTISIGEDTGSVSYDSNWTPNVLTQDASQGFIPGFLSDHVYVQAPGSESDTNLLFNTVTSPTAGGSGSPYDWAVRAPAYRSLLNSKLGANASKVELLATEINSVYSNPGKQTTSLVNGLFVADSLGVLLTTEYDGGDVWDLRNGWSPGNNNSPSLYGWRLGGDYGILGGSGTAPSTSTYVPYPTYFAEQLLSKMVHGGDMVVQASSNDSNLNVFAVQEANGHLDLLVINKSSISSLPAQFQIANFTPSIQAQLWQYGETQDTAQSQTTDGHSALASSTAYLTASGSSYSYTFPAYSMSVLDLAPLAMQYEITATNPVQAGKDFLVSVQAVDQYGNPITNYTGPTTVTATASPAGGGSSFPTTLALNSVGTGFCLATLQQAGSCTVTVSDSSGKFTGNISLTVAPAAAAKLAFVAQPLSTPTGVPLPPVSVEITDLFGNVVSSDNTDSITLSIASGPGAFTAGSTASATAANGVATFTNLTLAVPGTYTLSAVVPALYTGPFSSPFSIAPLQVVPGSFAGSPTGFSVQFNAPLLANTTTPILYGPGYGVAAPVPSVIVTTDPGDLSDRTAMVAGSLVVDSATNTLTFVATNTMLRVTGGFPVLPASTYTVILHSSAAMDGLQALLPGGGYLDGLGSGTPDSGDYTNTFVVNSAAAGDDVLWVPATADGPGEALSAPGKNQIGGGYPIYLDDQTGTVSSVQATLNYDPSLLTVTGVAGSGFTLLSSSTPGRAVLQYSGPALPTGVQTPIGFLTASVPPGTSSSPIPYKAKDLLHLTNVSINSGTVPVATSDALHLVAYVGDADGSGNYSSNDAVLITRVALQTDTGFVAYPLVDPVIVADTDGAGFIPADAALQATEAGVGNPTANLSMPPIPSDVVFQAVAAHTTKRASLPIEINTSARDKSSSGISQSSDAIAMEQVVSANTEGQDIAGLLSYDKHRRLTFALARRL